MEAHERQPRSTISRVLCLSWLLILLSSADSMGSTNSMLACASFPCQQNGTCHEFGTAFVCTCPDGYKGLRCETHESEIVTSACDSSPCIRGSCSSFGMGSFTCMCPQGWAGTLCERDINECDNGFHKCSDTEVCINTIGSYDCREACDDSWCSNGGTCTIREDIHEGFECLCQPNYAGNTCEILIENPCPVNQCMNGGVCDLIDSNIKCYCSHGYTGNFCGEDASPPSSIEGSCTNNLCQNGAECIPSTINTRGYTCKCPTGFSGALCQKALYSVCFLGGETYPEDMEHIVDCNECICQKGSWLCTKKYCGLIQGSFKFINSFSSIEGQKDLFLLYLKVDLVQKFSISDAMIDSLTVTPGSIQVSFLLRPFLKSKLDVQVVSSHMNKTLRAGNYTFLFNEQYFIVDTSSVAFQSYTSSPVGPNEDDMSLLIILVTISVVLFVIVCVAVAGILSSNRRKAKSKSKAYKHTPEEIQNLNNSNVVTINNRLYNLAHEEIHSNGANINIDPRTDRSNKDTNINNDVQAHIYEVVDENLVYYESDIAEEPCGERGQSQACDEENEDKEVEEDENTPEDEDIQMRDLMQNTEAASDEEFKEDDACCTIERDILNNENYYVKLEKPDDDDDD